MQRFWSWLEKKHDGTNGSKKDAQLIKASNLKDKAEELLALIAQDPYAYPPEFEFLKGELKGAISRRINKQHRLIYEVLLIQSYTEGCDLSGF